MKKRGRKPGVFYTKELLMSDARADLSKTAMLLLDLIYLRRQIINGDTAKKTGVDRNSAAGVRNNGQIILTYTVIMKTLKIGNSACTRAIDCLIDHGFIDITEQGGSNAPNLYGISDRWRDYSTENFKPKPRKKTP